MVKDALPQGVDQLQEFHQRIDDALEGLEGLDGLRTITGDVIVFWVREHNGAAIENHDCKFLNLLERGR